MLAKASTIFCVASRRLPIAFMSVLSHWSIDCSTTSLGIMARMHDLRRRAA